MATLSIPIITPKFADTHFIIRDKVDIPKSDLVDTITNIEGRYYYYSID